MTDIDAALGPIDVLVNSAGVNIRGLVDQLSEADWDTVVDINVKTITRIRAVTEGPS